jgi:hypothetical protein
MNIGRGSLFTCNSFQYRYEHRIITLQQRNTDMKRVLLSLAVAAVAASPILAAAEPEHREGPRPEAAREGHPGAAAHQERAIRADRAGTERQDRAIRSDRNAIGRKDRAIRSDRNAIGRKDEAIRSDRNAIGRKDEAIHADRAGAYRRGVETGEHRQVFERGNPGWWRGRPEFAGYGGRRPGYWFVPGVGYRGVPGAYWGYHWGVGLVVPGLFFGNPTYYVNNPWFYGVEPAPYRYHWMYLGPNLALVNPYGRIVRIVPNVF